MNESHHGTKRQAPARSPNPSHTNDDLSGEDDSSIPGTATYILHDGSYTRKAPARRRRKPFDSKRKAEVAEVRKIGACQICKNRKVRCTHVLPKIKTESSKEPKAADEHYPFNFDSSSIVKTGDWTTPEENKLGPLNADVHDPFDADFGWVRTPTGRRDRIALDVHDIENIINAPTPLEYSGPQGSLNSQGWAQAQPWMVNPVGQSFFDASATPLDLNATYASHASPPALTSVSAYGESELAFPHAVAHPCNVYGCESAHGFTSELELRRHQESRHPESYPPSVTNPCPAPGYVVRRSMRAQNLDIHIATNHPEPLEQGAPFAQLQELSASGRFGNIDQVDDFLIGENYTPLIYSNLNPFSSNSGALGDQIASGNISRRQTVSSRGANSPRGRPRAFDGVNRKSSLQKGHSRSRSRKQTASENGEMFLRAYEMRHSKAVPDREAVSMGSMSNTLLEIPIAAADQGIDSVNETDMDIWMQQNPEQNAMFPLLGPPFSQSFDMGASLQTFQGPNMFEEESGRHRGQSQSHMRNDHPFQASMPSNVGWNQEIDQFPYSLDSKFDSPYRNLQSHLTSEDIQSYQGDFGMQPFGSSEQFATQPPFRTSGNETYSGPKLNLVIPAASSQYLSNEDCSTNLHSRSTSIQTPVITISQAAEDADPSLSLLSMQTEIKSVPLQRRMASLPTYFSTSLSSSGANESLRTPVELTDMPNTFFFGSIDGASGGIGTDKFFMNNDYDNISNISGFADLNMIDDMQP